MNNITVSDNEVIHYINSYNIIMQDKQLNISKKKIIKNQLETKLNKVFYARKLSNGIHTIPMSFKDNLTKSGNKETINLTFINQIDDVEFEIVKS